MFHNSTAVKAAILTLLASAGTVHAASYIDDGYKLRQGEKTAYTASLAEITQGDIHRMTRTLDWRQPTLQLWFDLPASERMSEITLRLAASPLTQVPSHTPLEVQFNHDKPVPVVSNGNAFEATLSFDTALSRTRRNSLRITFPTPTGAECVTPAHGQWSIDLADSSLTLKGRAKSGHMSLTELETRLSQPAYAPRRIGLIAKGPKATDMQALAAQGLALRMPDIPSYSVTDRGTDFNVLMVKRSDLFDYIDDPMILNSKGARVFIPKGRPTQLIFTAETDAEILETLKLFSIRHLPKVRRPITSLGEIDMQSRLDEARVQVDRKIKLSELASSNRLYNFSEESWASGVKTYDFDVTDPTAMTGELLLRLSASEDVADTSRLRVALNGDVLGAAKLDRRRKSVVFDIPSGKLNATENRLSLLPELTAVKGYSCPSATQGQPNFVVGNGSKLILKSHGTSPASELSRLTATASVFAEGESYIALPDATRDYEASLQVLARLAKSAGQGLTEADYTRKARTATDRHILSIGPAAMQSQIFGDMSDAPKALKEALRGRAMSGDNLLQAEIERYASADDFAVKYAATQTGPKQVSRGGVAALYPGNSGKMIGIISASPTEHFPTAARYLVETAHWNALRGSVARWDKTSVLMAQTSQSVDGVSVAGGSASILNRSALLSFDLPVWNWRQVNLPSLLRPAPDLPSTVEIPVPTLRDAPVQEVSVEGSSRPDYGQSAPTIIETTETENVEGLRGRFSFETPDLPTFEAPRFGSFHDIKRETKRKWNSASRWTQDKVDDVMTMRTLKNVERKIDRAQDRVRPAGSNARQTLAERLPGQGIIRFADREYSVFGIILILSFISVVILMSMAKPSSRLGGRH